MNISKKAIFLLLFVTGALLQVRGQSRTVRQTLEEYVACYHPIAVAHMERYGIPASITLAQGILESDCGNSPSPARRTTISASSARATGRASGSTTTTTPRASVSGPTPRWRPPYEDHAEFLDRQPRYDSLFCYAATDYRSWARGLKAAGYATAPDYAPAAGAHHREQPALPLRPRRGERLYAAAAEGESGFAAQSSVGEPALAAGGVDPDDYRVTINAHNGYNVYRTNGVCYVLAKEHDSFENIGRQFRLSPRNLRKFNDVDADAQPLTGEVIYIGRKKTAGEGNARLHTAVEGETLYSVAQSYAIRIKSLRKINRLKSTEVQFAAGDQVKIRK